VAYHQNSDAFNAPPPPPVAFNDKEDEKKE
jgi:hypothetical protein